jgi:lysophospholipase L1-like esterase
VVLAAVRDPSDPDRLRPEFDGGDHLHLNAAGYAAMAGAVDLGLLRGTSVRAACERP